jgi:hypothetical protein
MGFASWRLRLSGICLRVGFEGVAEERTGLDADVECGCERDRRGSTAASPSWFTSADISMVGDGRVVRRFILTVILTRRRNAKPSR